MLSNDEIKKRLGEYAARLIEQNMLIGLGTGSTVYWLIQELGKRTREGLHISIVPTSAATKKMATEFGMNVMDLDEVDSIAFTIDGADEVDENFQLIKGGGGALLQEKIVAAASEKLIIIVDENKMVQHLGKFPLPVEVITFGWNHVQKKIEQMDCKQVLLRKKNNEIFITDHGHYILDCYFEKVENPAALNRQLHLIPGVVETGLFIDMAATVIVGYKDGMIEKKEK